MRVAANAVDANAVDANASAGNETQQRNNEFTAEVSLG